MTTFVPVSTHSYLDSKSLCHETLVKRKSGPRRTCSPGGETSTGVREMYKASVPRGVRLHATELCNKKGSFQCFRTPSFVGNNAEGAKQEPSRKRKRCQGLYPRISARGRQTHRETKNLKWNFLLKALGYKRYRRIYVHPAKTLSLKMHVCVCIKFWMSF